MDFKAPKGDLKTVWLESETILGVGLNSTTGVTLYHKSFDYKEFYNCICLQKCWRNNLKFMSFQINSKVFYLDSKQQLIAIVLCSWGSWILQL